MTSTSSSPATPPWVSELLAMNRKVVRNLSSSSYFLEGIHSSSYTDSTIPNVTKIPAETTTSLKTSVSTAPQNGLVHQQGNSRQPPVESNSKAMKSSSNMIEKHYRYGIRSVSSDEQMLRRTRGLNTAKGSTTVTEKSSPIREQDDRFMEDVANHQKLKQMHEHLLNGSAGGGVGLERQDSILEYGPGIVRKLRSRYQSLALRQLNSRPSLRRSASLENVLDSLDSSSSVVESINHMEPPDSPSPAPYEDDKESNYLKRVQQQQKVNNNKLISSAGDVEENSTKIMSRSVNLAGDNDEVSHQKKQNEQHGRLLSSSKGPAPLPPSFPRGRAAQQSDRKDRMRRARSVDALHRTKHEEEILEKFKAVVLPKEEIVIIEVSKPRANLNLTGLESQATSNNNMRTYYLATSNNNSGTSAADKSYPTQLLFSSATAESHQLSRGRSFTSPEHELPPHDIVRETARIFEKNQENAGLKKVGQALRLTKSNSTSSSVSGNSSTIVATTTQEASPPPSQQRGTVMAQGTPSTIQQQVAEPRDKSPSITTSAKCNGTTSAIKQVGIIRPTVSNSHPPTSLHLTNGEKVTSNNSQNEESFSNRPAILSPILSPSSQSQAYKALLHAQSKPPLSPKPIFTSSPKSSTPTPVTNNLGHSKKPSTPTQSHLFTQSSLDKPMIIIKSKENSIVSSSPFLNKSISVSNTPNSSSVGTNGLQSPVQRELSPITGDKSVNKIVENATSTSSSEVPPGDSAVSNGRASPSFKRSQYSGPLKNTTPQDAESSKVENGRASPTTFTNGGLHVNGLVKQTSLVPKTIRTSEIPAKKQEEPARSMTKSLTTAEIQPPPVSPRTTSIAQSKKDDANSSQLRAHQKQKSNQGGNSCMVFNFTARSSVPDYIEDDGLHHSRGRINLSGTVTDESVDDADAPLPSGILRGSDAKPIKFEGANVVINGKSSLQKKPKSQKLNISFNESATTTYEYPSELSLLAEDEASKEDMLGHKSPNVINNAGSGLGSYTPKLAKSDYQLGTYIEPSITSKRNEDVKQQKDKQEEIIEDYLKPDSETTTWSNEINSDIMF